MKKRKFSFLFDAFSPSSYIMLIGSFQKWEHRMKYSSEFDSSRVMVTKEHKKITTIRICPNFKISSDGLLQSPLQIESEGGTSCHNTNRSYQWGDCSNYNQFRSY